MDVWRLRIRSLLMLLAGVLGQAVAHAQGVPYVPTDDDVVLEHVSRTARPQTLATKDLPAALAYAAQSIKVGNEEGDPRYFGYAQSALEPWWNLPQPPVEVRQLRADILQWLHQFDAAKSDLQAVIAADGAGVMQAHLTLATLELVQGDAIASRRDCAALIAHVETLIAATCIASANSQMGHLEAVQKSLDLALAQTPEASPAALRWALTESADMSLRLRQTAPAEAAFRRALEVMQREGVRDPYLLAAYADFLIDVNRPGEVIALLKDLERIDNLLLRLTLAEDALGRSDPAWRAQAQRHTEELERRFAETRQRGDGVHQREEAIYLLKLRHEPQQALAVAGDNWRRQRELIDARVLMECAAAAGKQEAAAAARDWASRTGVQDARL